MASQHAIVLFDGLCNLCTGSVQFILQRDPNGYFKFASMQSEAGQQLLRQHHLPLERMDTFVVITGDVCKTRSDAALEVVRHLAGGWSLLKVLAFMPKPLRDWGYTIVANNRYRWFGRQGICMVPSPELMERFLT